MSQSKHTLKRSAAVGAVAVAFGALTPALAEDGYKHPLLDTTAYANGYPFRLSISVGEAAKAIAKAKGATKDQQEEAEGIASLATKGFSQQLDQTIRTPTDTAKVVDYPPRANRELLRLTAVRPPKGLEHLPIPVCAEQYNKVVGTWAITPKGDIVPLTGNWAKETTTDTACKEFVLAARNDLNTKLAQPNAPSQPPPPVQAQQQPGKQAQQTASVARPAT